MLPDGALTCLTGGRKSPVSVFPEGRLFLGCFIFPQVPFCTFLGCWCGWKNKSELIGICQRRTQPAASCERLQLEGWSIINHLNIRHGLCLAYNYNPKCFFILWNIRFSIAESFFSVYPWCLMCWIRVSVYQSFKSTCWVIYSRLDISTWYICNLQYRKT